MPFADPAGDPLEGGEYKPYVEPFNYWPELAVSGAIESRGWLCTRWTQREGWILLAWVGVQLTSTFRHNLASALAVVPYGYAWNEHMRRGALIWSSSRDVVPEGAAEDSAMTEFVSEIIESLPAALERIATAIGAA